MSGGNSSNDELPTAQTAIVMSPLTSHGCGGHQHLHTQCKSYIQLTDGWCVRLCIDVDNRSFILSSCAKQTPTVQHEHRAHPQRAPTSLATLTVRTPKCHDENLLADLEHSTSRLLVHVAAEKLCEASTR